MEEKKKRKNQKTKSVGNGEGTLYKSEALGIWVFQYYINGKRKTVKQKKNELTKDFKKRVTEIKSTINNGTYIEKSNDTFIDIAKKYINQKYDDGLVSDRSHIRNLETIKAIEKTCSNFINKPIQKVTIEDIENSKKNMRNYSNSVISKIWLIINKTFQIATSRRKIPFNIMLDETLTKPISIKLNKKIEALTVSEENKLIEILNNQERNHKYRNIILLQLYTGMRIGEVLGLTKKNIDLKNNTITVDTTLTLDIKNNVILGKHTKTFQKLTGIDKGKRTFPMNNNVKNIITDIMKSKISNINEVLFWDYSSQKFITHSEINSYLRRINDKYNITSSSLHSHRLRHTFITRCVEKGMFPKVIQSLVGHTKGSSITTDVYTSISYDFIVSELEKIN